jgi:hypothetical protein
MGMIMLERARAMRFDAGIVIFLAALWIGLILGHPSSVSHTWKLVAIGLVDWFLLSNFLVQFVTRFSVRACGESSIFIRSHPDLDFDHLPLHTSFISIWNFDLFITISISDPIFRREEKQRKIFGTRRAQASLCPGCKSRIFASDRL